MTKRLTAAILACLMCVMLLSACTADTSEGQTAADGKPTVMCTVFPVYDWVKNITRGSGKFDVRLLTANGGDLHSFQPSAKDIADIKNSELFVYIGGNSDQWADDIADESPQLTSLRLFDVLGDSLAEENNDNTAVSHSHGGASHIHTDTAEPDGNHTHDEHIDDNNTHDEHTDDVHSHDRHDDSHTHDEHSHNEHANGDHTHNIHSHDGHADEKEYDEHIWLSLRLAEKSVTALRDELIALDPENEKIYTANAAEYIAALQSLDKEYMAATEGSRDKTVILADRFPFLYLMQDYGITCYAAFPGCTSDTAASFSTVVYLIERLNEHKKSAVLILEGSNQSVAETVIADSTQKGAAVEVINSCQSVTARDIQSGASYLDIMRSNLNALKRALQ